MMWGAYRHASTASSSRYVIASRTAGAVGSWACSTKSDSTRWRKWMRRYHGFLLLNHFFVSSSGYPSGSSAAQIDAQHRACFDIDAVKYGGSDSEGFHAPEAHSRDFETADCSPPSSCSLSGSMSEGLAYAK